MTKVSELREKEKTSTKPIEKSYTSKNKSCTNSDTHPDSTSKGYIYTLEVMIAIAIVLIAVVTLFTTAQVPESPPAGLIKKQGYEVLEFLEQKDELRQLVQVGDRNTLKNKVRGLLPPGITIELDICTTSCTGQVPQGKNIISIDYYVAGYKDSFFNKKVKMWMWGNF